MDAPNKATPTAAPPGYHLVSNEFMSQVLQEGTDNLETLRGLLELIRLISKESHHVGAPPPDTPPEMAIALEALERQRLLGMRDACKLIGAHLMRRKQILESRKRE